MSGLQRTASGNGLNVSQFYDPSMAFTLQQGTAALQRSQAASGGVLSGAALKDLTSYASGVASQNYQNAVTNALAEQGQQTSANTNLESGALTGNSQLTPILNAGTSALGYQNTNSINTGSQLAQLNSNAGQLAAQGITQSAGGINSAIGGAAQALGKTNNTNTKTDNGYNSNSTNNTNSGYNSERSDPNYSSNYNASYGGGGGAGYVTSDEATKTNIQAITPFDAAMTPQNAGLETQGTAGSASGNAPAVQAIQPKSSSSGSSGGGGGGSSVMGFIGAAASILSFFSDENCKQDIQSMSDKDVEKSMSGMNAKSYQYNQETQAKGAPAGKQIGVLAQDVQKTPAKGMVNDTNPKTIDVKKATSFLLAGYSNLNKRLAQLEPNGSTKPEKHDVETKVSTKKGSK